MPGFTVRCSIPIIALAMLVGIMLFQPLCAIPDYRWIALVIPIAALAWRIRWLRPVFIVTLGFSWAWLNAALVFEHQLPPELESQDVVVEGMIASLPERNARRTHFEFDVEKLYQGGTELPSPGRILLNWYFPDAELNAGDKWRLHVRLKRPHSLHNPGGIDYEKWMFHHHIRASGYVRKNSGNKLLFSRLWDQPVNRLRELLAQKISDELGKRQYTGIIRALAVGDREDITHKQWQTLIGTGTNHLVAISGLHIGIIAGIAFLLMRRFWSRFPRLSLRWPAPKIGAISGMIAALIYAALAGFSIPTQRSVIMVIVVLGSVLRDRKIRSSHVLGWALLLVLLWDPLGVLAPGFWLSFAAVAAIFYGMGQRLSPRGLWWKWGRIQVLIAIALMPLLLILFQRVSLISPIANIIAVPWISLVVVPLTLLGTLLILPMPALGGGLLVLANSTMGLVWPILNDLVHIDWLQWLQPAPPLWAYIPAALGTVWLLAPRGIPGRWLGGVMLAPIVMVKPARPQQGEAWFTLLDVGQGLSAVVETATHVLVFDAGPATRGGFNAGSQVVMPFLRHYGVRRIDTLIVSHGHMDHRGGVSAVLEQSKVKRLLTSVPDMIHWKDGHVESCVKGQNWEWDGVRFEMLYPIAQQSYRGNDASCVLRVKTSRQTVLLPGDIERRSEKSLLKEQAPQLPSDIIVAPHHGSNTSSTAAFLKVVHPHYVLFAVGYRNRYGFPKPAVEARYTAEGARLLDSATDGAITFHLGSSASPPPDKYRLQTRHYWNSR